MDTPSDNLILRLLQEMRPEALARDGKTQAQIGTLADVIMRQTKRIDTVNLRLDTITKAVEGLRTAQHTVAIAFDHQTTRLDQIEARLDQIEEHLGLDKPKH